jgi:hypothetical protein
MSLRRFLSYYLQSLLCAWILRGLRLTWPLRWLLRVSLWRVLTWSLALICRLLQRGISRLRSLSRYLQTQATKTQSP